MKTKDRRAQQNTVATQLYNVRKAAGLCVKCGQLRDVETLTCQTCVQDQKARSKRHLARLRSTVFAAYGGYRCACCEELKAPEFMQLDHIENNGAAHRRELKSRKLGSGSSTLYRWLKNNGFPRIVQPMCADCNAAKGFYGECPHQREKQRLLQSLAKVPTTY